MRGDGLRKATSDEGESAAPENERLTQLVADLSVANMLLKKPELGLLERRRYERVSADKKREILRAASSPQTNGLADFFFHNAASVLQRIKMFTRRSNRSGVIKLPSARSSSAMRLWLVVGYTVAWGKTVNSPRLP
jgi:hypothetical protein